MIDIILLAFIAGVFYGGFKAGAKFTTFKAFWTKTVDVFKNGF